MYKNANFLDVTHFIKVQTTRESIFIFTESAWRVVFVVHFLVMNRQNGGGAGGGGEGAAGKIVASAHQGTVSNQPLPAQLYTSNSMKLPPPKVAPQQIVGKDIRFLK